VLNVNKIVLILFFILIGEISFIGYKAFVRQRLFLELKPVQLKNCNFKRFGDPGDGGYLMCDNLMQNVESAYSYGISGTDEWGCDISKNYNLLVHQYDCFNLKRPVCGEGNFDFHEECIGDKYVIAEGKPFDSLNNQIIKNKDQGKLLVIKMDVEGAEWDSILSTPAAVLNVINQLSVEFHGVDQKKYIKVIRKLKKVFYIVDVHFNNFACDDGIIYNELIPFPAWAYEVLFVNKRVGILDETAPTPQQNQLSAPNDPKRKDCQANF
jgi:hypothetical protein